jgi:hypothetical protein
METNYNFYPKTEISPLKSRNKILITEQSAKKDIKKVVAKIKLKKKKELSNFHTDTILQNTNQRTTTAAFSTDRTQSKREETNTNNNLNTLTAGNTNEIQTYRSENICPAINIQNNEEEYPECITPQNRRYNTSSNFFYSGISSVVKSQETVRDFVDKTRHLRKMQYAIKIQKEQILQTKEELGNQLDVVIDKMDTLKDNKQFFEDSFMPKYNSYIKMVIKQVDYEKYILSKIQAENITLNTQLSKMEYDIRHKRAKLDTIKEYKIFLNCVKEKKSLSKFKVENDFILSKLGGFNYITNAHGQRRFGSFIKRTLNDIVTCYDANKNKEAISEDPNIISNCFEQFEKDILLYLKEYNNNEALIKRLKEEKRGKVIIEDDSKMDEEGKIKIRENYLNAKLHNEQLKQQLSEQIQVKIKLQNAKQMRNIYDLIHHEFPLFSKRLENFNKFQTYLEILNITEKTINFLNDKFITYKSNNSLSRSVQELEKANERERRIKHFNIKREELLEVSRKKAEKEEQKLVKINATTGLRKVAPRIRPFSKRIKTKGPKSVDLDEDFKSYLMY